MQHFRRLSLKFVSRGWSSDITLVQYERKKEYLFIFLRHLQISGIAVGTMSCLKCLANTLVGEYIYIVPYIMLMR
jgi:hypothetical protein